MQKFRHQIQDSFHSFKDLKSLVSVAIMGSLSIVLRYIATINIGPYIRIGFSGVPHRAVELLFGPVMGSVFGGVMDVVNYFLHPMGPFFFGFTLNAILVGVIYGVLLYKKPVKFGRIVIAVTLEKVFINCGLTTLWLSILYGKGFFVLLPGRILANAIMLPIDCIIYMIILTYIDRVIKPRIFNK